MKMTQNFKRILSALLVFVLVFSLMPVTALAADTSIRTAAIFFSDVHDTPSAMQSVLSAISTNGVSYETIGLVGDTYTDTAGSTATTTAAARTALGQNAGVYYAWGDHDEKSDISDDSALLYSGSHYYIYHISDADMRSKAGATSSGVTAEITEFQNAAASMDKTKVLFIMSHAPLHARRGDNTYANNWYTAISGVADQMDVVVFWAHNHTGETSVDTAAYYVAKDGSETMTIYNGSTVVPNFTYMNAGYINANGQNPARKGVATTVEIYDDVLVFQDYTSSGKYTNSSYAHNVTVTREFASKPSHEHSYYSEITEAATCTQDGTTTYTCSCGDSYTETIPATGHSYVTSDLAEPTCTENGSVTYICSVCGDTYTEVIEATGHDYESVVTDPTNTEEGYTTHTCKVCGDVVVDSFVSPLDHNYEAVIQEPTCTEDGSIVYTCTDCGDSYTEVLSALGHCYETITDNATCTEDGSVSSICIDCGETEPGTQTEVIPATGHNYTTKTTDPTCTQDGSTITYCSNCGDKTTEVIPATGHNYTATLLEPTCTKYGYTRYTCSVCSLYYYDNEVAPLGHSYTTVVTAPTCTEAGFTTNTCDVCGDVSVTDSVAALGHSYTGVEADGYMTYTCANCNSSYTEEILSDFSYIKASKFTTADSFVITLYSRKNYYALSHKDNILTAIQVTVSNNEITSDVTEDMLWRHSSKKLYYKDDGQTYYLTTTRGSTLFGAPNLSIGTSSPATINYSSSRLKVGSYYLRFSNNVVSLNSSGTTTYLYKQTD